jgi:hypothetical protein
VTGLACSGTDSGDLVPAYLIPATLWDADVEARATPRYDQLEISTERTQAMRACRLLVFSALAVLAARGQVRAKELFLIDFEQGADLTAYEGLDVGSVQAEIVRGGPDGNGHCLRLHNPTPATSCPLCLRQPIEVQKNLILSFDYRVDIEPGYKGAYLGMSWFVEGEQWFWTSDEFSSQWRHSEVQIPKLKSSSGKEIRPGLLFSYVQLYGRVKEVTNVRTATKARMTVWFDNIRLHTGLPKSTLTDLTRDSYSNPPMFDWPGPDGEGRQKLQYSTSPDFPEDATLTVETEGNFFMPDRPIEPGSWYWRVWTESQLTEGWSDIERIVVLPNAHRFVTDPVPINRLCQMPRPRLLAVARLSEPKLTEDRKAQLVQNAKKLHDQGVPEHPGPHVPGDPRWPTWIDWYGKVAGKITGGTGRRLERIAACAVLTQDRQVIDWTKRMALDTCKWDPEGGSAMRRGDIGAHHLLRGLNWCYDACYDSMTPDERETLKEVIVQRANQFYRALNPFRKGEANNHAWLRAFGVAESGIVLAGDHDEAVEWTEYVRQLYVGRFLCCLGYQGENNEGVSYWSYGLMFIIDYADMIKAVCGIDLYQHPWLNQTARFPLYCAPPHAWAVSFADTGMPNHGVRGPAQTHRVRDLALRTRDPYALWYSGQDTEIDGLTPRAPIDLPASIHYRHIGVAIFNTSLVDGREGVTVAMHSGPYFAGHQHPDQNHFVIHAYGEKLAIDGGYYDWYGSPHFKAYSMQTLAHNTLLIDGEGQAVCTPGADGRVAAYFDSPGYGYVVGDASDPDVYGGRLKQFDRRILFIKPGFAVIHDLVASHSAARYDWLLHAIAPIEAGRATNSFSIRCERAALHGRFFSPMRIALAVETEFPAEPVNRYSTDPVPSENYFPEWVLYAAPMEAVSREEFFATMQIQRLVAGGQPQAQMDRLDADNAHAVRLQCDGKTHLIISRKHGAEGVVGCEGLDTDGQLAAVELAADGTVLRAMAIDARFLRCNGKKLFEETKPTNWAAP